MTKRVLDSARKRSLHRPPNFIHGFQTPLSLQRRRNPIANLRSLPRQEGQERRLRRQVRGHAPPQEHRQGRLDPRHHCYHSRDPPHHRDGSRGAVQRGRATAGLPPRRRPSCLYAPTTVISFLLHGSRVSN